MPLKKPAIPTLPSDPLPVSRCFDKGILHHLIQQTQLITTANALLKKLLPASLCDHCQVLNIQKNLLIVETDHATWNTRLRYLTPELLDTLKQHEEFKNLSSIHCRVNPKLHQKPVLK